MLLGEHFLQNHDINSLIEAEIPKIKFNDYDNLDPNVNMIFVYGTLRPDSTKAWSKTLYKIGKVTTEKATISHACLFREDEKQYPTVIYSEKENSKEDIVHGYLITSTDFKKLLECADDIECCPKLYQRIIVDCKLKDKNVKAYLYTKIFNPSMTRIMSGDFMNQ